MLLMQEKRNMAVKAKLMVRLLANDVVVAESENDVLWRRVLSEMQGGTSLPIDDDVIGEERELEGGGEARGRRGAGTTGLAKELGVKIADLDGACTPENKEPFIHLDERCWEAFKKNTPARGPKAVAPIQLAGTLLCLWFKQANIDDGPSLAQAQAVLGTIGERDNNASRAIKNCEWLQTRGGKLRINASRHSRAIHIAKAYVMQSSTETD